MSALSKYDEHLFNYPARGGGLHQHIMGTACLAAIAAIPAEVAIQDMNRCFAGIKTNEALDAVKRAFTMELGGSDFHYVPPVKAKPKKVLTLKDFIKNTEGSVPDLSDRSPYDLPEDPETDAWVTLEALYNPDEFLFIGGVFDTRVDTVRNWLKSDLSKYPHIIPNTMTGDSGMTDTGKYSYRCEATVSEARYAVCEMDDVSIDDQALFWTECLNIGIPVAAIIHSGRKSLHAWVKVDCGSDIEKWDEMVRGWWFKEFGVKYGLDSACQNRARLSRLPGHKRESGGVQRLIYLNGEV